MKFHVRNFYFSRFLYIDVLSMTLTTLTMTKKRWLTILTITTLLHLARAQAMIMRNNALMNKMVSHFQKGNYVPIEPNKPKDQDDNNDNNDNTQMLLEHSQKPEKIMNLMQDVLCRNFPSIPCNIITEDETLRKLIEKSIQQIKYKSLHIEKTTAGPAYHLTLFPTINSEDLSNFLQERQTGFFEKRTPKDEKHKSKKQKHNVNSWSQESTQKSKKKKKKDSKRTPIYSGRKKIRKFYPHKIKYKDKSAKNMRNDFGDYSEEKLSMSVESPDMTLTKRHQHLSYKVEPVNPPVWRIDYMKHGEPSLTNMLGYEDDRLKGKLVKTGPSVIVDENILEQAARKDVLHNDVYIKKNFAKKAPVEINSEGAE